MTPIYKLIVGETWKIFVRWNITGTGKRLAWTDQPISEVKKVFLKPCLKYLQSSQYSLDSPQVKPDFMSCMYSTILYGLSPVLLFFPDIFSWTLFAKPFFCLITQLILLQNLHVFQYLKAFLKCCGKQRNQGRLSKFSFWSTNSHVWLRSQTEIGDYKTVNLFCRIYLIGFAVLSLSRPTLKIWIIIKGVKSKNKFSDNLLHSIMKLN